MGQFRFRLDLGFGDDGGYSAAVEPDGRIWRKLDLEHVVLDRGTVACRPPAVMISSPARSWSCITICDCVRRRCGLISSSHMSPNSATSTRM